MLIEGKVKVTIMIFTLQYFLLFISYSFEAYKCRCFLAAIDYSKHIERETARDKTGNIRFELFFFKSLDLNLNVFLYIYYYTKLFV